MLDQPSSAMLGGLRSVNTAARLISAIDEASEQRDRRGLRASALPCLPMATRARESRPGERYGADERRASRPPKLAGLGSQVVLPASGRPHVCALADNSTPSRHPARYSVENIWRAHPRLGALRRPAA
jgi:hypothetical protein